MLSLAATDAATTPKITGIYTNLRYNTEGGDLLGTELLILPGGPNDPSIWTVVVQIAEGGAPVVSVVPLYVHGANVEFSVPLQGIHSGEQYTGAGDHITGTLGKDMLTMRWSGGTVETLKRGKSYWQ